MTEQEKKKKCAELVGKSKEVIRETFRKFKPLDTAITWTGGKDRIDQRLRGLGYIK